MSDPIRPALTWKPVPGYEGIYDVSICGKVRRRAVPDSAGRPRREKVMKQWDDRGYRRIMLCADTRRVNVTVHILVAAAFLGPRPDGYVVNHKDGVKHNNHADNLEYVTPRQNERHAARMGLKASGESHGSAKLTEGRVRAIRQEHQRGMSMTRLALLTGMSQRQIMRVLKRKAWTDG